MQLMPQADAYHSYLVVEHKHIYYGRYFRKENIYLNLFIYHLEIGKNLVSLTFLQRGYDYMYKVITEYFT